MVMAYDFDDNEDNIERVRTSADVELMLTADIGDDGR